MPIVAPSTPGDCFYAAIEAARIALKYRTPGLPALRRLPGQRGRAVADPRRGHPARHQRAVRHRAQPHRATTATEEFWPYLRDPATLARPWAIPGTPGLMHRIGGLEKADGSGDVSYDPANHELMTKLRVAKVAGIAADIPLVEVDDPDGAERAGARLGIHLRRHPGRHPAGARPRATRWPTPTSATSTRSRPTWATSCGPTARCWSRR